MSFDQLYKYPAWRLKELVKGKKIEPEDILNSVASRIEECEPKVKGYVRLFIDEARQNIHKLPKGSLWPLPLGVKDNICIKGKEVTCSSKILKGFVSPYNATVVERLLREGALIIGMTNMDEFAFGSSCETSCYGPTHNPYDLDRVPGGSSGGSAAVVASGEAVMALGSDTGGSIRQPASFCGIVGLKPTYGRVSRWGLIAFGSSLDQIGPLTRDIRDCALLLDVICGGDRRDSTCVNAPRPSFEESLEEDAEGLVVGLPREYFIEGIEDEVKEKVEQAVKILEKRGIKIKEISLPHTKFAVPTYYIVGPSEASSNLARFDGVQYGLRVEAQGLLGMYKMSRKQGFGLEAKRRILFGTYSLSSGYYEAYYLRALKVRTLIKRDFEQAFKEVNCIITPTSPTTAFKIGEKIDDPLSMYLSDIFTISANLAGIPALSMPCGLSKDGLPVGVQIMGPAFREDLILKVGYILEREISLDTFPQI